MAQKNAWLKTALDQKGRGARTRFADATGLTPSQVTAITGGKRDIQAEEVPEVAGFFGWEPVEVLDAIRSGVAPEPS